MKFPLAIAAVLIAGGLAAPRAQAPLALPKQAPSIDEILSLKRAGSPELSPDGQLVAYTVRETNWDDNAYETEVWLVDTKTGVARQLTNGKKSSLAPAWSPDGSRVAFISDRTDKRQLYVIKPDGGEAEPLTSGEEGVGSFAWSPDGTSIAYTSTEGKPQRLKDREKKYGEFEIVDQEHRMTHLFVLDVASKASRPLTHGAFTVGSFDWSPDGKAIAFDHRINSDPANGGTADIAVVNVADGAVRELVTQEGPDSHPLWSPDGTRIAFESSMANPSYMYTNRVIATVAVGGGTPAVLMSSFDEDPSIVAWKPNGLFFAASERTFSYLFRFDTSSNKVAKVSSTEPAVDSSFSLSKDGTRYACLHSDAKTMAEVAVASGGTFKRLTDLNSQTANWTTSTLDVVSWKSQDGATIEGVLHKPANFDPARKYPLLVVIHGGPTGVSRAVPFTSSTYPIDVWVPRGILVLEPNYRGSAGYGENSAP